MFEQISAAVKQQKFIAAPVEGQIGSSQDLPDCISISKAKESYAQTLSKFHTVSPESEEEADTGTTEEAIPPAAPRAEVVDDLVSNSIAWEAAGICFGRETNYHLLVSLALLAGAEESIDTVRLWGKVLGRESDYFVAECTLGSAAEGLEEGMEEEANKHTYWVCAFPGAPWKKLPPLKPQAVVVTQQLRRFLTGNLEAKVSGYPPFPGKEADFLRATIALVNSECAIAPKGYFKVEEENAGVSVEEEFEVEGPLDTVDKWEVFVPKFNQLGRVTAIEEEDEEGNPVVKPEGWEVEWLRPCAEEDWVVRSTPALLPGAKSQHCVARSLRWPGAYAVSSLHGSWTNIYVGYGYAAAETPYTPPMPPPLQAEYDTSELKEQEDVREDPTPPEEAEPEEE